MEEADEITRRRLALWKLYHEAFAGMEHEGLVRRPIIPPTCQHNAHMYYLLLPDLERRTAFIGHLKEKGIGAVFHYVPLHSSDAGLRFGRTHGHMTETDAYSERLVRLPLWLDLTPDLIDAVIEASVEAVMSRSPGR